MAQKKLQQKVMRLRSKGMSYSQIKKKVKISKSTLSVWLKDHPLSEERIRELRDNNPKRIERFRNTMAIKKAQRLSMAYKKASADIGRINKRDLLIAGFFLYWGEGSKTTVATSALTNTNPTTLLFFIKWLRLFSVKRSDLRVKLHLYSDMDIEKTKDWWSKKLRIPLSQFRKPYIKKTIQSNAVYKGYFKQGTCSVIYEDVVLLNYILMGLKYLTKEIER